MVLGGTNAFSSPMEWTVVDRSPPGTANPRWIVAPLRPRGHFKIGGDVVSANERMAYLLGREIGMPVPALHTYEIFDPVAGPTPGVISVESSTHWGPWLH